MQLHNHSTYAEVKPQGLLDLPSSTGLLELHLVFGCGALHLFPSVAG